MMHDVTLPKTNIAPENRPSQKETIVFQPSIFRGYVSFGEYQNPKGCKGNGPFSSILGRFISPHLPPYQPKLSVSESIFKCWIQVWPYVRHQQKSAQRNRTLSGNQVTEIWLRADQKKGENGCPLQDTAEGPFKSLYCFQVTRGERKAKPGQVFLNQPQRIK